jgi:ABC-type amino acid transport substrate-binding protein
MHSHASIKQNSEPRWTRRNWLRHCALTSLASLSTGLARAQGPALTVVYPNLNGNGADNLGYRVLELALQKSGKNHALWLHPVAVNDERARAMLRRGEVHVVDFGSGAEFEKTFAPVYFPIDRGLLGHRLSLIHYSREKDFARINTLQDLRQYRAGQGLGWTNNAIMQTAGVAVVTGPTLESLFPMLEARRFDFLPLGLNEVFGYSEQYGDYAPSTMLDPHTVLVYRFARLFYVRPDNTELHETVLSGLKKAFADGSFQKLLNNDPSIHRALLRTKLSQRAAIAIDNPFLTDAFQAIPDEYFYKPAEFK